MDRRAFMKALGLGVGAMAYPGYGWSQPVGYNGPLFVHIAAIGGWDTTLFCDPKGRLNAAEANPINRTYNQGDIQSPAMPSPITWAPTDDSVQLPAGSVANEAFFNRHYQQLLVLNGIDLATVNHATGTLAMGSGFGDGSAPAIGALLAATRAPDLGLTFWDAGGFSRTNAHVARTRVSRSDRLAFLTTPNQYPAQHRNDLLYQPERDFDRAMAVVRRRAQRRAEASRLPRLRQGLRDFARSHQPGQGLDVLRDFLPPQDVLDNVQHDMTRQIILGAASYQAGLTCAMAVAGPGLFDTHDDNDNLATQWLGQFLGAVDEAWGYIVDAGLADRTIFYLTSDLGRTPTYNPGDGKDHWSVTSAMMMGAGIQGNRVIGASTHDQLPRLIDPRTLEVTDDVNVGVRLTPMHIHAELRHLLGIADGPLSGQYDLQTPRLGII